MRFSVLILLIILAASCQQSSEESPSLSLQLQGTWLLYEQGYSPGAGYVTNPVPEEPPQIISFSGDQNFSSNLNGQQDYRFYTVTEDTVRNNVTLRLFKSQDDLKANNTMQVFEMEFAGGNLTLRHLGCIEGCHWSFKRRDIATDR